MRKAVFSMPAWTFLKGHDALAQAGLHLADGGAHEGQVIAIAQDEVAVKPAVADGLQVVGHAAQRADDAVGYPDAPARTRRHEQQNQQRDLRGMCAISRRTSGLNLAVLSSAPTCTALTITQASSSGMATRAMILTWVLLTERSSRRTGRCSFIALSSF